MKKTFEENEQEEVEGYFLYLKFAKNKLKKNRLIKTFMNVSNLINVFEKIYLSIFYCNILY